jgi:hypothetical protein
VKAKKTPDWCEDVGFGLLLLFTVVGLVCALVFTTTEVSADGTFAENNINWGLFFVCVSFGLLLWFVGKCATVVGEHLSTKLDDLKAQSKVH